MVGKKLCDSIGRGLNLLIFFWKFPLICDVASCHLVRMHPRKDHLKHSIADISGTTTIFLLSYETLCTACHNRMLSRIYTIILIKGFRDFPDLVKPKMLIRIQFISLSKDLNNTVNCICAMRQIISKTHQ